MIEKFEGIHMHSRGFSYYLRLEDLKFILELVDMVCHDDPEHKEWSDESRVNTLRKYFDDYQEKKPLPKIENLKKF